LESIADLAWGIVLKKGIQDRYEYLPLKIEALLAGHLRRAERRP